MHPRGGKTHHQLHREAGMPTRFFIPSLLSQDQQTNQELVRIMGEFEITDQSRQSTSKGDDWLAMMDEL